MSSPTETISSLFAAETQSNELHAAKLVHTIPYAPTVAGPLMSFLQYSADRPERSGTLIKTFING